METTEQRLNRYLVDAISAERNFQDALATFSKAEAQPAVQELFASFSQKAKTQHERLTAVLQRRGGTPSSSKTALAELLAFSPLTAQLGHTAEEKNTQHLMIVYAAAAAEMAMYESLIAAGEAADAPDVVALAKQLQTEEEDDHTQTWALLQSSAADSFESASEKHGATSAIKAYIEDAIAAEKTFEDQLTAFAKESEDATASSLYTQHAAETRAQYEELTSRLDGLGGSSSLIKSVLAHIFGAAPKIAQLGHDVHDRQTQNLMMAYAVENAEVAMYESLAVSSRLAGDSATEELARTIQAQEKATAEKVWTQIASTAIRSMRAPATE